MSVNDQPSVLAVCVPVSAMDAASLDLKQVLAAREQAVARCDMDQCHVRQCDAGQQIVRNHADGSRCDECDDSSCGMNVVGASGRCSSEDRVNGVPDATAEPINEAVRASFFHADSGKKALELLRMLRFDLLVTGDRLPDMPVSHLIRRVRVAWPWQKWAMVGAALTTDDEIAARTLGAMAVFDAPPDWDVISSLAATAASRGAEMKSAYAEARAAGGLASGTERISPPDQPAASMTGASLIGSGAVRPAGKSRSAPRATLLSDAAPKRSVG